ncbi:MAG: hypothetical protein Q7O66_10900, partial [Dehalococcoidia bacterium]|nr:hypothetical protein [Dehalococcoidia bacterium]
MRRKDVSPGELPKLVSLKQANTSWLKIERETGIPRRIAKRAYEQWQRNQAWEQLKEARKDVAAEEFRKHLDALTQMADSLIGALRVPSSSSETSKADDLLAGLWQKDVSPAPEPSEFAVRRYLSDRDMRRIERRNRLVFQALQAHTQGKVKWEALEEWKKSWDDGVSYLAQLRKQALDVMKGYLAQKPGLKERMEKATALKDIVDRLVVLVLGKVWKGVP